MDVAKPNKIKAFPVLVLLLLMPLIVPIYILGMLVALIHLTAYCGYKNTEKYFMVGRGFETNDQMVERLIKTKLNR